MTCLGGVCIFSGQSDLPEVYVYFQIRVTSFGGVCIFSGQSDLPEVYVYFQVRVNCQRCTYIFRLE